jgi:hypothetical protein
VFESNPLLLSETIRLLPDCYHLDLLHRRLHHLIDLGGGLFLHALEDVGRRSNDRLILRYENHRAQRAATPPCY